MGNWITQDLSFGNREITNSKCHSRRDKEMSLQTVAINTEMHLVIIIHFHSFLIGQITMYVHAHGIKLTTIIHFLYYDITFNIELTCNYRAFDGD